MAFAYPANGGGFRGIPDPYAASAISAQADDFRYGSSQYGPDTPVGNQTNPQATLAQAFSMGFPVNVGNDHLGSFSYIAFSYTCPPWGPEGTIFQQVVPRTLVWTQNRMDTSFGTKYTVTLPQLQQLLSDAYAAFEIESVPGTMDTDDDAVRFRELLETYGEDGLEQYINAKNKGRVASYVDGFQQIKDGKRTRDPSTRSQDYPETDLKEFAEKALTDQFRYLTKVGILATWSFAGPVITTGNGNDDSAMNGTYYEGDHYNVVNVGMARRLEVANIFGSPQQIQQGSKLWCILRRKRLGFSGKPGAFEIVAGGSKHLDFPLACETRYLDESGRNNHGHVWKVGTVIEKPTKEANRQAMQLAINITGAGEQRAYEALANLPSLWVNVGGKI